MKQGPKEEAMQCTRCKSEPDILYSVKKWTGWEFRSYFLSCDYCKRCADYLNKVEERKAIRQSLECALSDKKRGDWRHVRMHIASTRRFRGDRVARWFLAKVRS